MMMRNIRGSYVKKHILLIVTMFFMPYTFNVSAETYEIIDGEHYSICKDLIESLNVRKDKKPIACEFRVDTDDTRFSTPAWKDLNPKEHLDLIEKLIKERAISRSYIKEENKNDYAWRKREEAWNKTKPLLLDHIRKGESKLQMAMIDVNHDGEKEITYRFYIRNCDPSNEVDFDSPAGPILYVSDGDGYLPDHTFRILSSPPKDIFFYKNRTYLSWWHGRYDKRYATISIYETFSQRGKGHYSETNVCVLKYNLD